MSASGHSDRCERSRTDPRRCRCTDCGGTKHGIQAVRERLGHDEQPQETEKP